MFSAPLAHTTAHYFARAIRASGERSCTYLESLFDPALLQSDDLLFFVDPAPAWPLGLEKAPCVTVAYLIDVHQDLASRLSFARFFDVVFVAQKDFVDDFRRAGHQNVYWLPLACDPVLHAVQAGTRDIEVGFVGRLGAAGSRRHSILSSILPKFKTNDYRRYYRPDQMAAVYAGSKIVLNVSVNNDVNMRVFEAMGAGALLLTERVANGLGDLFTEGVHYVGFSSAEEAIETAAALLRSDEERERIAAAGRQAVFSLHTYDARWAVVQKQAGAATRNAPARRYDDRTLRQLYGAIFVSLRQPRRLAQVWTRYGVDRETFGLWLRAFGRWTNARIPVTPNAIKARLHAWRH